MDSENLTEAFVAETQALVARRMPFAAAAFALIMGCAWVFEHFSHPEHDAVFAVLYAAEVAAVVAAAAACRVRAWNGAYIEIAAVSLLLVACLIGYYNTLVDGDAAVLALALAFLTVGGTAALPWGARGQLPVAVGVVVVYGLVVKLGLSPRPSSGIGLVGLASLSVLSVMGAIFVESYRLSIFRHARELEISNAALRRADREKTDLVAAVSHELRTPLSSIMGYTDLLLEGALGGLSGEARSSVERISQNATQLLGVINDLIDLSRLESGHLQIEDEAVPLDPLFNDMTELASSLLRDRPVRFAAVEGDHLVVRGDPQRLRQVLTNLLTNASKYTSAGEITLRARRTKDGDVIITMEDSGIGIAANELTQIFEPFRRGSRQESATGVGLGLSLSKRLAELMGGEISAQSAAGRGSIFTVRLKGAGGDGEPS